MYSTLYHTLVVGLMAVCETHPLLSLPRSPFASVSNGSIPSLSVSSAFVASQILFGPSDLLARAIIRSARIVQGIVFTLHEPS